MFGSLLGGLGAIGGGMAGGPGGAKIGGGLFGALGGMIDSAKNKKEMEKLLPPGPSGSMMSSLAGAQRNLSDAQNQTGLSSGQYQRAQDANTRDFINANRNASTMATAPGMSSLAKESMAKGIIRQLTESQSRMTNKFMEADIQQERENVRTRATLTDSVFKMGKQVSDAQRDRDLAKMKLASSRNKQLASSLTAGLGLVGQGFKQGESTGWSSPISEGIKNRQEFADPEGPWELTDGAMREARDSAIADPALKDYDEKEFRDINENTNFDDISGPVGSSQNLTPMDRKNIAIADEALDDSAYKQSGFRSQLAFDEANINIADEALEGDAVFKKYGFQSQFDFDEANIAIADEALDELDELGLNDTFGDGKKSGRKYMENVWGF